MSLSFVSSTVQTTTSDGKFEEAKIESTASEVDEINRRNAHKPLFEQLRDNQDEAQAKQDELQREIMRGTRALNEEDVAHLDALEKQRQERERIIQQQTQDELALFRAKRAEFQQGITEEEEEEKEDDLPQSSAPNPPVQVKDTKEAPAVRMPLIKVVKKRKRKADAVEPSKKKEAEPTSAPTAVGSLLSGYGSSDDSDS